MKEDVIFFGASRLGKIAIIMLNDKYNIIGFCDNNATKWGENYEGFEVFSPSKAVKMGVKVIITSSYYEEISKQLIEEGITNFDVFSITINNYSHTLVDDINIREVNLGKFLTKETKYNLKDLTFISGGSGILDYLFLRALVLRFNIKNYLEIGIFLGESIAVISEIVERCYSISLPDEKLDWYFNKKRKRNFSRYFSKNISNVIHFMADSHNFNYDQIDQQIGLVFIDGDHTYKGILVDTKKIFDFIDSENTFVVWHDLKREGKYRMETVKAIFDALPEKLQKNVFGVDNNMCGIYIPEKYLFDCNFDLEPDAIYSYKVDVSIKKNLF